MNEAVAQNARMRMWGAGKVRWLALDFIDGRHLSTMSFAEIWDPVISIALRGASVALKTLMAKPVSHEPQAATSLPVCPETLSVLRLFRLLEGLRLPTAERVAEGWMQVPLQDRANGTLNYQCDRVVNVQLLGLVEPPCAVLMAQMPNAFPSFIKAARYAGLGAELSPCWRAAETFLGSTCICFAGRFGLEACLAISDCTVSYPVTDGGGLPEAREAMQALIDILPTAIAADVALRLADWNPVGHEILEITAFLNDLKNALAQPAPR